jgi:hypothetical protein
MRNYKTIKRIFEQEAISPEDTAELGSNPIEMPAQDQMMPAQDQEEPAHQEAIPAPGEMQSMADPMVMTVRDFIEKCRSIDPLVCMGIEAFVEKNRASLNTPSAPAQPDELNFSNVVAPSEPASADITFSNAVAPAPAQNFDHSDKLNDFSTQNF